ncbi:nucleotidyltransferase family protein [Candidatus Binatia bacterium]|nr:nucleotidyltransferase family protein [Candidatus Binatia bacterium]
MITLEDLRARREAILEIAQRYGARDVRVFGSVARGDVGESSDVDLIVRFDSGRSLFDHGGLIMDLRDLLGVEVDVISEGGMRDRFRKHVMKEAILL